MVGAGALRLDSAAGIGLTEALARRGGRSWSTPMPELYTKPTFVEVTSVGVKELAVQFAREGWVVGESTASAIARTPELERQVLDLYEKEYIAAWDQVLNDIALPPMDRMQQMKNVITTLASKEDSPLRGLLKTIDENTFLVTPEAAATAPSMLEKAEHALQSRFNRLIGNTTKPGLRPGTQVTVHFTPIHELVSGPPGQAKIDALIDKIAEVAKGVGGCGGGLGKNPPKSA